MGIWLSRVDSDYSRAVLGECFTAYLKGGKLTISTGRVVLGIENKYGIGGCYCRKRNRGAV